MVPKLLPHVDWVRAAAQAHMILSQGLSHEELDTLLDSELPLEQNAVRTLAAA